MFPVPFVPLILLLASQSQDASEIMSRSVEAARANREKLRTYAFREHYTNQRLGDEGGKSGSNSRTWDVIGLEGATYRKLIAIDDKALPPKLAQREERRLREETARRRREGLERTRRRLNALSYSWHVDYTRIPAMYLLSLRGEEIVGGRPAYVIEGVPNPAFQPRKEIDSDRDWKCFAIKLWIDKAEYQCLRMEIDVTGEGSRLQKGSWLREEYGKLNEDVWVSTSLKVGYSARFLKLIGVRGLVTITYSDFRKFQVDSKLLYDGTGQGR